MLKQKLSKKFLSALTIFFLALAQPVVEKFKFKILAVHCTMTAYL
jgi:hypothetical protein